jgi:hypothetical protein
MRSSAPDTLKKVPSRYPATNCLERIGPGILSLLGPIFKKLEDDMAKAKKKADKFRCGGCDQLFEEHLGLDVMLDLDCTVVQCWRCAARIQTHRRKLIAKSLLKEVLVQADLEYELVERIMAFLDSDG